MIYLIEGVPGSGKTTYAMQHYFVPAFRKGKKIVTNIAGLKLPNICAIYDIDFDNIDNVSFVNPTKTYECQQMLSLNSPYNSLIIMDETQNYFNSRDFKTEANLGVIPFLTEHRHYGYTIIALAQSIDSVDITFRRLASQVIKVSNMGYAGIKNSAKLHFYETANFNRSPLATSVFRYDLSIFKCFESVEAEAKIEKTKFIFPKKLVFVLFAILFFVYGFSKLSNSYFKKTPPATRPAASARVDDKAGKLFEKKEELCFGGVCLK
jgi:zona occludens toxin (predicted ATPase)